MEMHHKLAIKYSLISEQFEFEEKYFVSLGRYEKEYKSSNYLIKLYML